MEVSARYPVGRLTITRKPDGTISARASAQQDGATLEASLELPSGSASLDEQAVLTYMARPYDAQLPIGAHLVRTYEVVRGNERFTLQERGEREPSHAERYDTDEGREHMSRTWSASKRTEGRSVMSGRTRLLETSTYYLHAERRRIVTEVLDEAGEIIVERETATSSDESSSWELRFERDGSGQTIVTDSRRNAPWAVVRRSDDDVVVERTVHGCTSRLRHDSEGRLLSREYVAAAPDDPTGPRCRGERTKITRDTEGRVVRAETSGTSEARRETRTFRYDVAGRPVHLTEIRAAERREVRVVYDASGRLIREVDEWSRTDEPSPCDPSWCIEYAVASSRHLDRTFDAQGRLVRSSVTRHETVVDTDGSTETEHRSVVDYAYEGCAAETMTAEPGHEALIETPIELL